MRKLRASKDKLVLGLGFREGQLLLQTLRLYPVLPSAGQRRNRARPGREQDASQRLLAEALAEQRAENKRHLRAWLGDPSRFRRDRNGFRLCLAGSDLEWLLQILNDVRVGSWVAMGSPEDLGELPKEENAPHCMAMEIAGAFQMELLAILDGTSRHERPSSSSSA